MIIIFCSRVEEVPLGSCSFTEQIRDTAKVEQLVIELESGGQDVK